MDLMSINQIAAYLIDGIGDRLDLLEELENRRDAGIDASMALARMGKGWRADVDRIDATIARVEKLIARFR